MGHDIERKIVWPLTDFAMALTILYLFYTFGYKNPQLVKNIGKQRTFSKHLGITSSNHYTDNRFKTTLNEAANDESENLSEYQQTRGDGDREMSYQSNSSNGIPILNPLLHFVENFEKLKEFEEYEKEHTESRSSGFTKRSNPRVLKQQLLLSILE